MTQLQRGLYEQLIDAALEERLRHLDDGLEIDEARLRPDEAGDRLAMHLGHVLRRAVESLDQSNASCWA